MMASTRRFQYGGRLLTLEATSSHTKGKRVEESLSFDLSQFGLNPDTIQLNGSWSLVTEDSKTKAWFTQHLIEHYTEEDVIIVKGKVGSANAQKKRARSSYKKTGLHVPRAFNAAMTWLLMGLILLGLTMVCMFPVLLFNCAVQVGISKVQHFFKLTTNAVNSRLSAALSRLSIPSSGVALLVWQRQKPLRNSAL